MFREIRLQDLMCSSLARYFEDVRPSDVHVGAAASAGIELKERFL